MAIWSDEMLYGVCVCVGVCVVCVCVFVLGLVAEEYPANDVNHIVTT